MSLVHNLEPKRRVAALRFPSFLMQNFALCLPKDNFPSIMFLNLNRSPPQAEMCVIYEMLRLVVSELLFLLVNRSLRTTVLAAPAVFACVCARARGRA